MSRHPDYIPQYTLSIPILREFLPEKELQELLRKYVVAKKRMLSRKYETILR